MIGYIFILIGVVLYYLAYKSPKTDIIVYIFAGLFLLMGGVTGLVNNDLSLPIEDITISETIGNVTTSTEVKVLSTSIFYTWVIPLIVIFLSLYLLLNSSYLRD